MDCSVIESLIMKEEEEEEEEEGVCVVGTTNTNTTTSSSSSSLHPTSSITKPKPIEGLQIMGPPPFLTKTYEMVEDPSTDSIVSWSKTNNSFVVWDYHKFSIHLLPKYFKHSNFSSFIRQLNTYGFRKVDPDRWEFANEGFLRGQKHLLKTIKRRRHVFKNLRHERNNCVELGQYGLEGEVETLKRDKNVLMVEVVKLRQQQQSSIQEIVSIEERLQGTEKKQQLMIAFLAKALKNRGFVESLVRRNEQKRKLFDGGAAKKQRLPCSVSIENFEKEVMKAESEMETLLSTDDTHTKYSVPNQYGKTATDSINSNNEADLGDVIWEELLNDEMIAAENGDQYDGLVGNQTAVDVEVDDLVAKPPLEWCEDVGDLVEQMGYLGSKQ
ncbi:hypothetical protein AQUCO_02000446v1 [Aquilegia coerulea]|uniref:HSF-type DNA-binding domain-containing protein n=1 Tax=Aquilegia coerulea TaxID=218851 RepID=A0A2G5DHM0_AQUCA|nr:hypothetical protein AQUCO_02000446v1 [Aquilegia coerulea]